MEDLTKENMCACIYILAHYIENNKLKGTSVTNALGEMTIKGVKYQIQVRLEKDDIISEDEVYESVKIDLFK